MVVVDASVSLRWLLTDSLSAACWRLYERIAQNGARIHVPALWYYEMVSGLTKAQSFRSITQEEARQLLDQVFMLEPEVNVPGVKESQMAFEWTIRLGRSSAYDSYYLTTAKILNCELWTADRKLFNAARDANLDWVHWIEEA